MQGLLLFDNSQYAHCICLLISFSFLKLAGAYTRTENKCKLRSISYRLEGIFDCTFSRSQNCFRFQSNLRTWIVCNALLFGWTPSETHWQSMVLGQQVDHRYSLKKLEKVMDLAATITTFMSSNPEVSFFQLKCMTFGLSWTMSIWSRQLVTIHQ